MKPTKYIINDESFKKYNCYCTYVFQKDDGQEYAAYSCSSDGSGELTLAQYLAQHGNELCRVVSSDEFDRMILEAWEHRKQEIEQITPNKYSWMLECLPPCRWTKHSGVELFHVSERITGNLVDWAGQVGDIYVRLVDEADAELGHITNRMLEFTTNLKPL
ncbi:hypothetical protein [Photobacterium ganghwense]|uniref:hypothetical protein n=1 Tax=Photobacterium ganghwense TaxID=320778 RepID=UPI001A907B07|nr:hypothetical protein [Photobacterium ganghwense]QSV17542.1 hypothetical protein FH974_25895 [Photobacterium ganghwense]